MSSLFSSIKPLAKLGKSGFDLSQKHVFSCKPGQAIPCFSLECVPGDHHQINVMSLHRSMTMNTAAFLRGKFRYDFFFVPYSQLWHPFNQFIDQRKDKHTSLQKGFQNVPVFSIGEVLGMAILDFDTYHLRYVSAGNPENPDSQDNDIYGVPFVYNLVRLLDMLGYGNYQYVTYQLSIAYGKAKQGQDYQKELDEAKGYAETFEGKYCNLFRIAAYQHIWYDYYRNKYYDLEAKMNFTGQNFPDVDFELDYVDCFNFDDLDCSSFATSILSTSSGNDEAQLARIYQLFQVRYVQWKKDLFTSVLPGTQFGAVSSVDLTKVQIQNNTTYPVDVTMRAGVDPLGKKALNVRSAEDNSYVGGSSYWNINNAFDVLALKRSEALQRWKENTLRAGSMVDSNFRAHYGVTPRYESDNNVQFLGSYEAMLQVNAVEATAATGDGVNGSVGELAATGTAVLKGDTIKFDGTDFGVIMCIASYLPESEYDASMIDKANRLHEQFDFFTPEYQNLGLEPVQGVDLNANLFVNGLNTILGYAPRYWMYKTAVDKVHGQFSSVQAFFSKTGLKNISGELSAWVSPRKDEYNLFLGYEVPVRKKATFYASPSVYDPVMGVTADFSQSTDIFLNNVYFDVKSVRPMTVLGLPDF